MADLINFVQDLADRAEDQERLQEIEDRLEALHQHRIVRDRSNPLEDLSEKEVR